MEVAFELHEGDLKKCEVAEQSIRQLQHLKSYRLHCKIIFLYKSQIAVDREMVDLTQTFLLTNRKVADIMAA